MQGTTLAFDELQEYSTVGALKQKLCRVQAPALDGKTGSWEKLLEVAHIGHKKGPEPGTIAASIADFIGLWACATVDVRTVGEC